MAKDQNFRNNGIDWNIHLEDTGELSFKADGKNGNGNTRMVIERTSGEVAIGGSNEFGQLRLMGPGNETTTFLGRSGNQSVALLGGPVGLSGRIQLFQIPGRVTVDLDGEEGTLVLGAEGEDGAMDILDGVGEPSIRMNGQARQLTLTSVDSTEAITMNGQQRRLELFDNDAVLTASLQGGNGVLQLSNDGGTTVDLRADATLILGRDGLGSIFGKIIVKNALGQEVITCDGSSGVITCVDLIEQPIPPSSARSIAPLMNALDRVLALRGVTYQREQVATPKTAANGDAQQIGFVGQELEAVCPELVTTDAAGGKSVNYSRMTAVLVEAVKEQQRQICEQAAALEAIWERLGQLSVADQHAKDFSGS